MLNKYKIGKRLKELREINGLSQREILDKFANKFNLRKNLDKTEYGYINYIDGLSQSQLVNIEKGKSLPTLLQLKYYHEYFDVDYEWILDDD